MNKITRIDMLKLMKETSPRMLRHILPAGWDVVDDKIIVNRIEITDSVTLTEFIFSILNEEQLKKVTEIVSDAEYQSGYRDEKILLFAQPVPLKKESISTVTTFCAIEDFKYMNKDFINRACKDDFIGFAKVFKKLYGDEFLPLVDDVYFPYNISNPSLTPEDIETIATLCRITTRPNILERVLDHFKDVPLIVEACLSNKNFKVKELIMRRMRNKDFLNSIWEQSNINKGFKIACHLLVNKSGYQYIDKRTNYECYKTLRKIHGNDDASLFLDIMYLSDDECNAMELSGKGKDVYRLTYNGTTKDYTNEKTAKEAMKTLETFGIKVEMEIV